MTMPDPNAATNPTTNAATNESSLPETQMPDPSLTQATVSPNTASQSTVNQPANQPNSQGQDEDKTFSQADLEFHVKDRLRHARSAWDEALLTDLGVESLDEVKVLLKDKRDQAEAEKTELERETTRATKLEGELKAANERIAQMQLDAKKTKLDAEIEREARDAKNVHEVITLIRADQAMLTTLESAYQEEGQVKSDVVKKLVDDFRQSRPHHFGSGNPGNPAHEDGRHSEIDQKALKAAMEADMLRLRGTHF
ncbi:hypothetical protein G4Y79_05185 [Phototrophicus methaneseepsis]|uniref:Uncharacterized protein n=1 Tax=Phototrophicus methaneseepsis TaxID=2710758 RepID=A0A7S8IFS1_9CHLR|nr:hypothetical protein [Phototrophicus methaneseepsis]QPC83774.1 hypothetical protein G4Y79_05185 [Phototrophicus methaneseepsis]